MESNERLNCPNCGAPIMGERCEYCGTVFYDFSVIDSEKPSYIKMKIHGKLYIFKALLTNVDMKILNEPEYFYYDNIPVQFFQIPEMTISTEFKVIEDNDILYKVKIED